MNHGLKVTKSKYLATTYNLIRFSYVDWASGLDDEKSTIWLCVYFGENSVSWCARKQHTIFKSSVEAEYKSSASLVAKLSWFKSLIHKLKLPQSLTPIVSVDNLSTTAMANNLVLHAHIKHIELNLYFVIDKVLTKEILLNHVPTVDQVTHIFTKSLAPPRF